MGVLFQILLFIPLANANSLVPEPNPGDLACPLFHRVEMIDEDTDSAKVSLQKILTCKEELKNCACEILGQGACDSVVLTSNAAIEIYLPPSVAKNATAPVREYMRAKKRPYVTRAQLSELSSRVVTAGNPLLASIFSGISYLEVLQEIENNSGDLANYQKFGLLYSAFEGCKITAWNKRFLAFAHFSSREAPLEVVMKGAIERTESDRLCTYRMTNGDQFYPVYKRWPLESCSLPNLRSADGAKRMGRLVNGVCIGSWGVGREVVNTSIDGRVIDVLNRFTQRLNSKLPRGRYVKQVHLLNCESDRPETGEDFSQGLAKTHKLTSNVISQHAFATACDVGAVTFGDRADPKFEERLEYVSYEKKGAIEKRATPYCDALKALRQPAWPRKSPGDVGRFYSELETLELAAFEKRRGSDSRAGQVLLGALVRNSLEDAGVPPVDCPVNGSHDDHLHFAIPSSALVWDSLDCDPSEFSCPGYGKERAELLEPYVDKAGGVRSE